MMNSEEIQIELETESQEQQEIYDEIKREEEETKEQEHLNYVNNCFIYGKFKRPNDKKESCCVCNSRLTTGYRLITEKKEYIYIGPVCIKNHKKYLCELRKKIDINKKEAKEKKKVYMRKIIHKEHNHTDYGGSYLIKYGYFVKYKFNNNVCLFIINNPKETELDTIISECVSYNDRGHKSIFKSSNVLEDVYFIYVRNNLNFDFSKGTYQIWINFTRNMKYFQFSTLKTPEKKKNIIIKKKNKCLIEFV